MNNLIKNNCYNCKYKDVVPGDAHIKCNNPDPDMTGDPYGIRNGWFFYPVVFDPTWMTKKCANFEEGAPEANSLGPCEQAKAAKNQLAALVRLIQGG